MEELLIKKVGYVALIGRPNSGKSTFINTLIEEKVSIVSNKPQTTRKTIKWIYNDEDSQIIFFDTAWVNEGKEDFFVHLKNHVIKSLENADLIIRFIDSSRESWSEEDLIWDILNNTKKPIIEIYSKIDVKKRDLEIPQKAFGISSKEKRWFKELLVEIKKHLPTWPLFYPDDYYTDQDYETRIEEIVREKLFLNLEEEIPHSVFVEVGEVEDTERILRIQAYIYTESDSQKIIVIGKNGQLLTKIGTEARQELEEIYGKKIFLGLRVKTLPKWRKNKKLLSKLY